MAKRESAPQRVEGDSFSQNPQNHQASTPYSSGAEGFHTDLSSSHSTPWGSPEQAWRMENGLRRREIVGMNEGFNVREHSGYSYPTPYPAPRGDAPATRRRTAANNGLSPTSRNTTSSPPLIKGRKARSPKGQKPEAVNLDQPLSILTKDSTVPIKDMETFVHRSIDERMKEKEKKNGYIVRPMNAFMLYRSAYADRAKSFFAQNNHQIVSKATGQSWRLEPKEVQDFYKALSDIEREHHAQAWPHYKFTPTKNGVAARKRKFSDVDSDGEDQDASDWDWTPGGSRRPQVKRTMNQRQVRKNDLGSPYPTNPELYMPPINRSEFGYANPGRPMPIPLEELNSMETSSHYYLQSTRPYDLGLGTFSVEDVRFERSAYPHVGIHDGIPSGLPGNAQEGALSLDFGCNPALGEYDFVDPELSGVYHPHLQGMFTESGFADYHGELLAQEKQQGHGLSAQPTAEKFAKMLSNTEDFGEWIEDQNNQQ